MDEELRSRDLPTLFAARLRVNLCPTCGNQPVHVGPNGQRSSCHCVIHVVCFYCFYDKWYELKTEEVSEFMWDYTRWALQQSMKKHCTKNMLERLKLSGRNE